MQIPTDIVEKVDSGECILFLGAGASHPSPGGPRYQYKKAPPGGRELALRLADRCKYKGEDRTNLQRVSLYYELLGGNRDLLENAIKEMITKDKDTGEEFMPSPAMHMLAALPFPIVITTNYDRLFDTALFRANTRDGRPKQPIKIVYDPELKSEPKVPPSDFGENKPILVKLHGDIDEFGSIVVTEEDYIRFIQKMSIRVYHPLHEHLLARLASWPMLFIGYSLKDYNLRLLFKNLELVVEKHLKLSYSVDPEPDDIIVSLMGVGMGRKVHFIEEDLWTFVPELFRRVIGKEYDHET